MPHPKTLLRGGRWITLLACALAATAVDAAVSSFLTLPDAWAPARYSPGSLDRAAHAQERFGLLAESFARWSGKKTLLPLLVLAPDEWSLAGLALPPGLAEATSAGELAVPAWGDQKTVALWVRVLAVAELPAAVGSEAGEPVRGTRAEAASLGLADLVAELEGARLLLDRADLRFAPAGCADLVAALVARAAFERYETPRLPELRDLFTRLARRVEGPVALAEVRSLEPERRLAAWARLYLAADRGVGDGSAGKAVKSLLGKAGDRRGPLLIGEVWKRLPAAQPAFNQEFAAR